MNDLATKPKTTEVPRPVTGESRFSIEQLAQLNASFDKMHPREIIQWAADTFGDGLAMTSSFGADSMCTIHLAKEINPDIKIIVVNTGYLFPETLAFMEEMRERFHLNIHEFHTHNDPIVWLSINGEPDPAIRNNRDACCAANKHSVLDRAMKALAPAALLRGVRADQTEERSQMKILQWQQRYSAWAISPILRWSNRDVYNYMKQHNLPHHPLYEKGYPSIGCNPLTCTRPVTEGEDDRAGRWSGSTKKECGINLDVGVDI